MLGSLHWPHAAAQWRTPIRPGRRLVGRFCQMAESFDGLAGQFRQLAEQLDGLAK